MGLPSGEHVHAWHRDGPGRGDDPRQAPPEPGRARTWVAAGLSLLLAWPALPAAAETLRIATYDVALTRKGPGLLWQDISRGKDPQIAAVVAVIAHVDPDVLLLTGIDYDHRLAALRALSDALAEEGVHYSHLFAYAPNSGRPSAQDLDGDGIAGGPGDTQGFGRFPGAGGMALLSRLPIDAAASHDFTAFPWRELPGTLIAGAGLSPAAARAQRLPSTGHWDVALTLPEGGHLRLLAFAATPPVFDGPEDRNGRRNHDEAAFWRAYLDGKLPEPAPEAPFVLLGKANLDPADGEGRRAALAALLHDPRLQDPRPRSAGAAAEATPGQHGDPGLDTADWSDRGPGNLRVDYVLPSAGLKVTGAGVFWPEPGEPGAGSARAASRHRLVWVDLALR